MQPLLSQQTISLCQTPRFALLSLWYAAGRSFAPALSGGANGTPAPFLQRGMETLRKSCTHAVCKCHEIWGSGSPVPHACCGVSLAEPAWCSWTARTDIPELLAQQSISEQPLGTEFPLQGVGHSGSLPCPTPGSPCHCTPVQMPVSHTQSKPLANCCQAWTTPGEEEFPCKMQDHTHRPATAQQGDLCLV